MYRKNSPELFDDRIEHGDIVALEKIPRSHKQIGATGLIARGIKLTNEPKRIPYTGYRMPTTESVLGQRCYEQMIDTMENLAVDAALYGKETPVESKFLFIAGR